MKGKGLYMLSEEKSKGNCGKGVIMMWYKKQTE